MNSNHNTILELQQQGRFAEAGYGRLFAYDSLHFNAMIDARSKAKFIRNMNPDTYDTTQHNIVYSGPTVFFRQQVDIKNYQIDKMDIKSAYLSYLINEQIKKPGIFRIKHNYAYPISDRVVLYVMKFDVSVHNPFVKWFLNASAIHKKKFKSDGTRIWGEIGIFASKWMNTFKYINKMVAVDEATIIKSYTFHGSDSVAVTKSQIDKLYKMKEAGSVDAKNMLVQSTGWLSIIDKPTYYHMIQYIKYHLLRTCHDYDIGDDLVGVQTDCIFFRVTERTEMIADQIMSDRVSVANKKSSIGTYTSQRVNYDDIIANKARVVLK